jgi:hypothetical protein
MELIGDNSNKEFTYLLYIGTNVQGVPTWTRDDILRVVGKIFPCFTLQDGKGYYIYKDLRDSQGNPLKDEETTYLAHISTDRPELVDHLICLIKRAYKQECVGVIELNGMRFL